MQYASYPRITALKNDDILLVHQTASGAEKTINVLDAASAITNLGEVLTLSGLRAKDVSGLEDGAYVNLAGYYTIGDGGGGPFYYDADSVAVDNGGTIIQPNSGTGRWLRPTSSTFNIRQFGALGNLTHDDAQSISQAMNAVKLAGGGCLFIPAGKYKTTFPIQMLGSNNPNISILGEGPNVSVIYLSAFLGNAIELQFSNVTAFQPNRVTIEGIGLKSIGPGGTAIKVSYGSPPFTVNHNNITVMVTNVAIECDDGTNTWQNGIDIDNAGNTHITDTYISGDTKGQVWTNLQGDGIRLRKFCVNSHFSNVQVSYFLNAFHWTSEGGGNTEGLFFENCSFAQVRRGVYIEGNGASLVPRVSTLRWTGGLVELRQGFAGFELNRVEDFGIMNTMIIEGVPLLPYYGIKGSYVADGVISGVEFFAIDVGVSIENTSRAIVVRDCVFRGGTTQVAFSSGTTDSRSGGHVLYDASPSETNDNASNRIYQNSGYFCTTRRTTAQTVSNLTEDTVSWQTTIRNDLSMFDIGSPLVIQIPAGVTQIRVTMGVRWALASSGYRLLRIKTNDGSNWAAQETAAGTLAITGGDAQVSSGIIPVFGLTTVEASVYQSSGGSLDIRPIEGTFLTVEVVG